MQTFKRIFVVVRRTRAGPLSSDSVFNYFKEHTSPEVQNLHTFYSNNRKRIAGRRLALAPTFTIDSIRHTHTHTHTRRIHS